MIQGEHQHLLVIGKCVTQSSFVTENLSLPEKDISMEQPKIV